VSGGGGGNLFWEICSGNFGVVGKGERGLRDANHYLEIMKKKIKHDLNSKEQRLAEPGCFECNARSKSIVISVQS